MDKFLRLVLDDMITRVSPDNVTRMLEANQDVTSVTFVECNAKELLDFILEVQKIAVDAHIAASVDATEGIKS